jgi:hypothetical protein
MNQTTAYLNAPLRTTKATQQLAGLSLNGVVLFLVGLLIVASGFMSLRPQVFGLAVHPMLLPIAVAFPLVVISRITLFPTRILIALSLFVAFYLMSIVNGVSVSASEFFKMSAAYVTILTCALLVRKQGDFVAGAVGLSLAAALLASRGIGGADDAANIMDGANKNSYSMFALPAMLLSGFIALRMRTTKFVKLLLLLAAIPPLFVIFLGGNRSGYLGSVIVGFMLFWDRRGRGLVLVAAVVGTLIVLISQFGDTRVFDQRLKQTVEGNRSDDLRLRLIAVGFEMGLENPIIGVSPQQVPPEVARRLGTPGGYLETHNTYAHVVGGSGFICLFALAATALAMWFPFPSGKYVKSAHTEPIFAARSLMRMLVFLWFVRSMFTREILFNPAFNVAFGLVIGLYIVAVQAVEQDANRQGRVAGHGRLYPV